MAPQSQLEESANEPCAGVGEGSEISPLRTHFKGGITFLEVFFLDIAFKIASGRLKKAVTKKKTDKQTNKHTDLSRSRGRLDPVSRHFKRCNRSKKPSKEGPGSASEILLRSRLMGTSGTRFVGTLLKLRLRRKNHTNRVRKNIFTNAMEKS